MKLTYKIVSETVTNQLLYHPQGGYASHVLQVCDVRGQYATSLMPQILQLICKDKPPQRKDVEAAANLAALGAVALWASMRDHGLILDAVSAAGAEIPDLDGVAVNPGNLN